MTRTAATAAGSAPSSLLALACSWGSSVRIYYICVYMCKGEREGMDGRGPNVLTQKALTYLIARPIFNPHPHTNPNAKTFSGIVALVAKDLDMFKNLPPPGLHPPGFRCLGLGREFIGVEDIVVVSSAAAEGKGSSSSLPR